jgi:lipoprotein-releasing system permease protein
MSFAWFVARRYLTARRRQAFISLISGVSILGVGVGVMALIVALALMTGMQGELRDRILGSTAHIYVYKTSGVFTDVDAEIKKLSVPGVVGAAPAVLGEVLIQSSGDKSAPSNLKGIDLAREPQVSDLAHAMTGGSVSGLNTETPEGYSGIVLGGDLAKSLGVAVGDDVDVITASATLTPVGPVPHRRTFKIIGTFEFGFYEYDCCFSLVSLPTAESMLDTPAPGLIQLKLSNLDDAKRIHAELAQTLGPEYLVQDWTELNGSLYSALWLEKVAISLTIGLIVMVAALNIVASLVLLVMEKSRDIAILRTMGASAKTIRRIFMLQGLTIGLVGTIGGTIIGLIICVIVDRYHLIKLPSDVYEITYLPFTVLPLDVAIVVVSGIVVCFLATVYPARQAGRLDPAEALRNQ